MDDLRLLAIEQDFAVLEGANGEKYRLALDETLRKALRTERGPRVEQDSITPREIQEMIRSGYTVDEIVAKTGASFEFVEKFAVPVLEELEHVVSSAQSVRLSFIGERFGESNHIEFGVLIRDRLDQLGVDGAKWTARRNDVGGWQISCDFELDGAPESAKWSFDLRHLSLSPENEVALNLAASPRPDTLITKRKPGAPATIASTVSELVDPKSSTVSVHSPSESAEPLVGKNLTVSLGDTQEFADVIPFGRGRNTTAQVPVIAAGTSAEVEESQLDELDETENLLDGLRRRRDEREAKTGFSPILEVVRSDDTAVNDSDFDETTVWIESSDEVFIADEDVNQDFEPEIEAAQEPEVVNPAVAAPATATKKGRASMPSWDEIVFGTKADKDE